MYRERRALSPPPIYIVSDAIYLICTHDQLHFSIEDVLWVTARYLYFTRNYIRFLLEDDALTSAFIPSFQTKVCHFLMKNGPWVAAQLYGSSTNYVSSLSRRIMDTSSPISCARNYLHFSFENGPQISSHINILSEIARGSSLRTDH
jgi:hypothetical protein